MPTGNTLTELPPSRDSRNAATRHETHRLRRLDGLRAVAVLMVFACHVFDTEHGWEGVTLFFVLSGFLITGILRRARDRPDYWRSFYIKRAARILPPLVIFFALTIALYKPPLAVLPGYFCFGANIIEAFHHGPGIYFTILWSLAVEEHFYFVWPFAVRFLSRTRLMQLSLAILVLDPLLRMIATPWFHDYMPIYMLTPFQIDGLAAGSLLALLVESEAAKSILARWSLPAFLLLAGLYISLSSLLPSFSLAQNTAFSNSVIYTLVVLTMAALLIHTYAYSESRVSRFLASGPVFFMGSISYGFYLFHPLAQELALRSFLLFSSVPHGLRAKALGFLIAVAISWVSFHFYEKPVLRLGRKLAQEPGDPPPPALPNI